MSEGGRGGGGEGGRREGGREGRGDKIQNIGVRKGGHAGGQ